MNAKVAEIKPRLRGFIHAAAFAWTIVLSIVFTVLSIFLKFDFGICIYLLSQLLQYGISTFYHIPTWTPTTRRVLQHLDHMCIFILISGTQTSVLLNLIDIKENAIARLVIKLSWSISLIGILKIVVMNKLHNVFDLVVYIAHGMIVVPFYRVLFNTSLADKLLVAAGAVLYITGGVVYGLERPNPAPRVFGYHEIFHVFTIVANVCFAVIIARKYILSMLWSETLYPRH